MRIFVGFFAALCCGWIISYLIFKQAKAAAFLDHTQTDILKGYAILLVLWGHVGQYLGIDGIEFPAAVGVSIFLILSGYGIEKSFAKSSLNGFWKRRFLRVWLPFALCDTAAMILQQRHVTWIRALLNYTFIKEIYPFIWYFRFIFVCYGIFWLTGKWLKDDRTRVIMIIGVTAVWFVLRSTLLIDETPFLEPRQMLCFPVGVVMANREDISQKRSIPHALLAVCIGVSVYAAIHFPALHYARITVIAYNTLAVFTCMLCAIGFIWLVDAIPFLQNRGLTYIGKISFEIYVVHRYFINRFGREQSWLGLGRLIALSLMGAVILHFVSKWMNKKALVNRTV